MEGMTTVSRRGAGSATATSGGLALVLGAVRASATYEFRMQIRRRSLWLVLGLMGAWMLRLLVGGDLKLGEGAAYEAASWAWLLQVLMPIGVGVLLADRLVRDGKLKVDELLETAPAPSSARLAGKYLGATAATVVPMFLVYVLGLAVLVSRGFDASGVVATAIPAFVLIDLPGLLFVASFSVATPAIMPVPVYQFLYVGYWFWGNLMPPQIMPTLRDTWLAPIGWMTGRGFYRLFPDTPGPNPSGVDAVISILILLAGAVVALVAGYAVMRFRRDRA